MPWANETNRKRLRGYGDVFKNAAVRAGIYIDAEGNAFAAQNGTSTGTIILVRD